MIRLNLGSGDTEIAGFQSIDRRTGGEVFPLAYPDGFVDEIRASHVLEHFSHVEVPAVLADWVRALKPGGLLRVAVPDFQIVAEQYLAGAALPIEGYVMGGHVDANDHHGALFDTETLTAMLSACGLLGVSCWTSEIEDCAALPISLNLQGWKPPATWPRVQAVTSVPRLGFTAMRSCVHEALMPLGIGCRDVEGAFWGQCLTRGIEMSIDDGAEYVLTIDYDSVFTRRDVENLISAAHRHPEIDAFVPVQSHRAEARQLFTVADDTGAAVQEIDRDAFSHELLEIETGHFGLTLFRASAFARLQKPWLHAVPDPEGSWHDGRQDDDVTFWRQWRAAGLRAALCTRVAIGHLELLVRWPDRNMGVLHQSPHAFRQHGKPEGIWT